MLEQILTAHQQEAESTFQLIAPSDIFPTIGMQRTEHALVSTGGEVHDGVFFDGLVHPLSLRRDWALSGGSFASRNNPERIQNFPGQLGRAVVALSCPGCIGHFHEMVPVR